MGRFKELFRRHSQKPNEDHDLEFQHEELQNDEIRILKIAPGQFDDPIQCSLWHVSLASPPVYEALSYTWGDATKKVPITVDGASYHVTTNLETALRHIRKPTTTEDFWVDAICINQLDIPERNLQVARMRSIYEQAYQTIVWLGDYDTLTKESVDSAFELVHQAIELASGGQSIKDAVLNIVSDRDDDARVLIHIAHRPWFYRAWVVQEVTVSKELDEWPTGLGLVLGHSSVYLWTFSLVVSQIFLRMSSMSIPAELTSGMTMKHPLELVDFRRLRTQLLKGDLQLTQAQQLVAFLSRAASSRCRATDERDKIYAFLGLLSTQVLPLRLRPDYALTVEQIFLDYAVYMIQETRCLDILDCRSGLRTGLPSWVPDWSGGRICRDFHVGSVSHIRFLDEDTKMEVDCLILDLVVNVIDPVEVPDIFAGFYSLQYAFSISPTNADQPEKFMSSIVRETRMVYELLREIETQWFGCRAIDSGLTAEQLSAWINAVNGETRQDAPDGLQHHGLTSRQLYMSLVNLREDILADKTARDLDFWQRTVDYCSDLKRSFRYGMFQTANGSYGKVRSIKTKTRPGDAVCFIKGSSYRYLIRPVAGNWQLIGSTWEEGPVPYDVMENEEVQPWENFWAENREKTQRIVLE